MKSIIDKDNKSFCLAPWVSTHVWPNGNTYPCCMWDVHDPIGNVNDVPLGDIWNNSKMKDARVKMMKGEKISSCNRCYELENSGYTSYRDYFAEQHSDKMDYVEKTDPDGNLDFMNLHLWDLRLSNYCNFKCRSCGFLLSSSWLSDQNALSDNLVMKELDTGYYNSPKHKKAVMSVNSNVDFLSMMEEHYNCVDEIYFAGGEPLLMPEHYTILDKLLEIGRTDVLIRYSTNFSKFKYGKKHVFDYWRHFKNLKVWISVDGVGKVGEYIRHGYNDENFEKQIREYENSGIEAKDCGYSVTYSAYNYLHLFDLVVDFIKRGFVDYKEQKRNGRLIFFNPVSYPVYLDSRFIPNQMKLQFYNRLINFDQEMRDLGAEEFFINHMMEHLTTVYTRSLEEDFHKINMMKLKGVTEELDKLRKEKFEDVFPYVKTVDEFLINKETINVPTYNGYNPKVL